MTSCRIEIHLFSRDASGTMVSEGMITETFSSESEEAARVELRARTRHQLLKRTALKDLCYKSYLYTDGDLTHELEGPSSESFTSEEVATADAFSAHSNEHSETFPKDELQKRMQSGGPGHVVEKKS